MDNESSHQQNSNDLKANQHEHDNHGGKDGEHGRENYFFFVDGVKYESSERTLLGSQIKAMVPGLDPAFALILESIGNEPDRTIEDASTVSLDKNPLRFYTVPPATFG